MVNISRDQRKTILHKYSLSCSVSPEPGLILINAWPSSTTILVLSPSASTSADLGQPPVGVTGSKKSHSFRATGGRGRRFRPHLLHLPLKAERHPSGPCRCQTRPRCPRHMGASLPPPVVWGRPLSLPARLWHNVPKVSGQQTQLELQ